ncbi:glycerophosphodiester phosphodiesterase 1 isoform X2 [Carcharodon carcharias]|uniref:glycerophosphodiester phosphodiesterase 1 isoform X2 n=1 Tax=Carcharodon carcharias TaxID=13397 RepID=UPI001B7DFA7D|nr:glycerophosphodiester phosphodiesterase 1 isoform X2 [Carcharodon carcharias]
MDVTVVAGSLLLVALVALLVLSVCHPLYFPLLLLLLGLAAQALRYPAVPREVAQQVLRPGGHFSIIAHRGGGYDAPENTLGAIRKAAEHNATGVELDLEFTSDGLPILMHDHTVDRTTDGTGSLDHLTFEEVRKLNPAAKHRLHKHYPDEKVPTLEEAIVESLKANMTIYFDVKGHAVQAAAALKKMYQEYPELYNSSIVCSFDPLVILKMKQVDKNVATALTHRPWRLSFYGNGKPRFHDYKQYWYMLLDIILDWSLHAFLWKFFGISAFLMQKNFISMMSILVAAVGY